MHLQCGIFRYSLTLFLVMRKFSIQNTGDLSSIFEVKFNFIASNSVRQIWAFHLHSQSLLIFIESLRDLKISFFFGLVSSGKDLLMNHELHSTSLMMINKLVKQIFFNTMKHHFGV